MLLLRWIQNNQFILLKKRPSLEGLFFYSNKSLNRFLVIACFAIIDKDITARFNNENLLSFV